MTLGEKIQLARKKKGMSQEDLANMLNVSRQAVQKWESGITQPEVSNLVQISNMFDVSLDYLLKDIEETDSILEKEEKIVVEQTEPKIKKTIEKKRIRQGKYSSIKVWEIIGCILSPLFLGGSFVAAYGAYSLLCLLYYAVTIPICCSSLSKIKKSKGKDQTISSGVLSLLFVSLIGGILILTIKDSDYETYTYKKQVAKESYDEQTEQVAKVLVEKVVKQAYTNAVEEVNYKKECKSVISSSIQLVNKENKISKEKKEAIIKELHIHEKSIERVKNRGDYLRFKQKAQEIIKDPLSISNRRTAIIALIIIIALLVVVVGITLAVVIPRF